MRQLNKYDDEIAKRRVEAANNGEVMCYSVLLIYSFLPVLYLQFPFHLRNIGLLVLEGVEICGSC